MCVDHNDNEDDDDDNDESIREDDGEDDDNSFALELVIGYGWSQHLLSITLGYNITPSPKT